MPNDATEVMNNKYVIELRDRFFYNIQLTIPAGPEYLVEVVETLIEKREKAKKELRSIQKAIDIIQNSCEHKKNNGLSAWEVKGHTHKEISQCFICKMEVTA